ncbi:hypothetical protein CEXT_504231 [Caerostris extrusa]|uniref:Uncharacterized protein n=1 Tax=Caerostris extrusa TaxID=172846 RepID=A0AAV4NZ12_CAEEX|nr:hypothetical protein CEXT_504231 [Caerostris extrusa]
MAFRQTELTLKVHPRLFAAPPSKSPDTSTTTAKKVSSSIHSIMKKILTLGRTQRQTESCPTLRSILDFNITPQLSLRVRMLSLKAKEEKTFKT